MTDEGEKHPDAEHRQRLLAAFDHGIEDFPLQAGPILRYETYRQDHDDNEMQEAVPTEVGFVVRIEGLIEPVREQISETRKLAGKGHQHREDDVCNAEIE